MSRFRFLSSLAAVALAAPAFAAVQTITNDTYIDSYIAYDGNGNVVTGQDNTHLNMGHSAGIKAVTSFGSKSYPLAVSRTRTLFTLPSSFWTEVGSNNVTSAVVTIGVRNNMLAGRQLEMHPLTQAFVAGDGGTASSSNGGTANSFGNAHGADWTTPDGRYNSDGTPVHAWTGGAFDSTNVLATSTATGQTAFTWDIAALINNPTTRAEIQADGLLIKTVNDADYPNPQQFVSLYSYDASVFDNVTGEAPTITYTVVPEPAALATLVGFTLATLRRRRAA